VKKKQINAIEVAKLANVSQSTVSRVFTPGAKVSPRTQKRVLEAAQKIGYRPNALARGLITNKTNIIGLVMGNIQNPFYPEILDEFTKSLYEKGYHVLFFHTKNDAITQDEVSQFLEYNVEGVIVTDVLLSSNVVSKLSTHDIPIILFNRYTQDSSCHSVCCDNYSAGMKIGEYLFKQGHQKFTYITGRTNTSTSRDRERGFAEFLLQKGIKPVIEEGDYTYEAGYTVAMRVLKNRNRPDAIFCANDIVALGVIDAAKILGISIPNELSIVGFDDISMASWPPYSLTTWQQPVKEMIEATINMLLNTVDGEATKPQSLLFSGKLLERKSVKLLKNS